MSEGETVDAVMLFEIVTAVVEEASDIAGLEEWDRSVMSFSGIEVYSLSFIDHACTSTEHIMQLRRKKHSPTPHTGQSRSLDLGTSPRYKRLRFQSRPCPCSQATPGCSHCPSRALWYGNQHPKSTMRSPKCAPPTRRRAGFQALAASGSPCSRGSRECWACPRAGTRGWFEGRSRLCAKGKS